MKFLIAPDSFKECLPATDVAARMADGVRRARSDVEVVLLPLADGGEGTVAALVAATGGSFEHADVSGPLGETVRARFGILGDGQSAVIEMAAASGLELVAPQARDPLQTTTYGTGQLLIAAAEKGVRRIVVGIGGSATNDGGAGLAQALGFVLLDVDGREIGKGGGALASLARIEPPAQPVLRGIDILVACDVTNPLTGPTGASLVYGPQKGATPETAHLLDQNLAHLASVIRRDLGVEVEAIPGAGAAGGLGGGLVAFAKARLRRGIELILEAIHFRDHLRGATLCLTGEGSLDASSRYGKAVAGVAAAAREMDVPVVALAGRVEPEARDLFSLGVTAFFSVTSGPCSLASALEDAGKNLEDAAEQVTRLFFAQFE